MARHRRVNPANPDLQPCRCQDCLKQNPEGLLVAQSALTEHRHRERLRRALLSRADRLQIVSTVPDASGHDMDIAPESHLHEDQLSPSESHLLSGSNDPNPSRPGGSHNLSPGLNDEDTGGWLQCVVSEIRMRLETLYDCEIRLTFIKDPSPNIPFVLSNPESHLHVNAGDFALFQIPKYIHTIVDQYDLNPTLHVAIACPKCYALSSFTDEALKNAESAHEAHLPFPVCEERLHPDSPPCGTTLWHTRHSGKCLFIAPIRKQVFQDLEAWIGRILAVPGIEDAVAEHQQRPFPTRSDSSARDFVDSVVFRGFKGADGLPFVTSQKGPAENPDLQLVMSLGFDGFNPFGQRETHAQIQSTALYMVFLSLPEHLRYRQEYMFLVTVMPRKPKQHHVNHTLRILVKQLLAFLGRRCLLPISDIYNLNPESWIMRDPVKHRELAFEWKVASRARRDASIYKTHGIRFTELMELPYWDPILFTVIDDMHFGYLGLFKTHLREIWARGLILWRQEHRESILKQSSSRNVIGKDLLAEIWADMARSVLPSWIQAAPSRWGIPSAGKLSADEYKVVCSISLVVTLIRVWGYGNKEQPQSRHFQILLNFLELVRSMHIIFLRETSQSLRAYYKAHILNYLRGVLQLFPDVTLASNHHLALHIIGCDTGDNQCVKAITTNEATSSSAWYHADKRYRIADELLPEDTVRLCLSFA
ncbi:hypothetical protein F5877DRAFT_82848 [Lentinula edodes]|nr:hypothetical protein F5877DRAFT_82848 [Lentinula edodes]